MSSLRRFRTPLLALIAYVAAGLAWGWPAVHDPQHTAISGGRGDVGLYLWYLSHTANALAHDGGHGLFVTHALNAPIGISLLWNTSLILPGILLAPITLAVGPVLSLNLVIFLCPVLSAWSAFLCSGRYLRRVSSRFVTGLFFGFSPAILAAALAHYNLTLLMLVPPLLLLTADVATRQIRRVRTGALLGFVVACQFLMAEEVLALAGVAMIVLLVVLAAQRPKQIRPRLPAFLTSVAAALVVAAALIGYPLYVQLLGPITMHGAIQPRDTFVFDPTQLVTPQERLQLQSHWLAQHLHPLVLNHTEIMGYLGLPLVVLLVVVAWWRRHDVVARTTVLATLVLLVLSLGPTLHLAGHATGIPLPWDLASHIPLLDSLLPIRWMLVTDLLVALLVGLALDALPEPRRRAGSVLVALCLVPLIPLRSPLAFDVAIPAYFTHQGEHLRGTALVVPLSANGLSGAMAWQAASGTRFAMPGGYFVAPQAGGIAGFGDQRRPTEQLLLDLAITGPPVQVTPEVREHAAEDLAFWRATTVILGPSEHEPECLAFLTALLRRPPVQTEGVYLWSDVSPSDVSADQP